MIPYLVDPLGMILVRFEGCSWNACGAKRPAATFSVILAVALCANRSIRSFRGDNNPIQIKETHAQA